MHVDEKPVTIPLRQTANGPDPSGLKVWVALPDFIMYPLGQTELHFPEFPSL
jgi:hypothetical protein